MGRKLVCYADDSYNNEISKLGIALVCLYVEKAEHDAAGVLYDLLRSYQLISYHRKKKEIKGREFFTNKKFKEVGLEPFCRWLEKLNYVYVDDKTEFDIRNKERLLIESIKRFIKRSNDIPSLIVADANITHKQRLKLMVGNRKVSIEVKSRGSEKIEGIQVADIIAYHHTSYIERRGTLC